MTRKLINRCLQVIDRKSKKLMVTLIIIVTILIYSNHPSFDTIEEQENDIDIFSFNFGIYLNNRKERSFINRKNSNRVEVREPHSDKHDSYDNIAHNKGIDVKGNKLGDNKPIKTEDHVVDTGENHAMAVEKVLGGGDVASHARKRVRDNGGTNLDTNKSFYDPKMYEGDNYDHKWRDHNGSLSLRTDETENVIAAHNDVRVWDGGKGPNRLKLNQIPAQEDYTSLWNISEEIRKLSPVIFKYVPPKFHPDYQGFCWYNMEHTFRCLPYFYLLGMPKCGTTDLWEHIIDHPHIIRALKEPHWWTRSNRKLARVYISRSKSTVRRMEEIPESANKIVVGDGSASYLWDTTRWQDVFNPEDPRRQYFLPHVIRALTPNVKLIAAFREPVARLYSEYVYFSKTPSTETFHSQVESRIEEFNKCMQRHSARKCVYTIVTENGEVRPMIGVYSIFARDWLDVFPREQMLFIRLEDWHLNCETYIPKIFQFLEVAKLQFGAIQKICRIRDKNVNRKKKAEIGPMLNKTKTILRQFYHRWNVDLAKLLDDDKWLWNDENDW